MLCDSNSNFHCRGYSLLPNFTQNNRYNLKYNCHIHSEDSKVHGPKLLKEQSKGVYYERAPCLNGNYYYCRYDNRILLINKF